MMQLKTPVIVVGCKLDLRDEQQVSLEQVMAPIMQSFREIETCIECSALRQIQVTPHLNTNCLGISSPQYFTLTGHDIQTLGGWWDGDQYAGQLKTHWIKAHSQCSRYFKL